MTTECKWCGNEAGCCDCEERRTCDKVGQAGHRQCGALSCGCPALFGLCTEHGTTAVWAGGEA